MHLAIFYFVWLSLTFVISFNVLWVPQTYATGKSNNKKKNGWPVNFDADMIVFFVYGGYFAVNTKD